jgi:hypothetical protein
MSKAEAATFELKVKRYARISSLIVMALATTLFALRGIAHHWPVYSLPQKFPAVLLLLGLIANPISEIWSKNGAAQDSGRFRLVMSWNSLLLTALVLISLNLFQNLAQLLIEPSLGAPTNRA